MHAISLDELTHLRQETKGPILLALLERWDGMRGQLGSVETAVRKQRPDAVVCMAHPDYLESIMRSLEVVGTPTFVLLRHNREIARLLGAVAEAELLQFVSTSLDRAAGTPESAHHGRTNGEG